MDLLNFEIGLVKSGILESINAPTYIVAINSIIVVIFLLHQKIYSGY